MHISHLCTEIPSNLFIYARMGSMSKATKHMIDKKRCFGNKPEQTLYADYHDNEWGVPVHEDRLLFEMLILEGAQAGLNWETILKKREAYRELFFNFDPKRVSRMSDQKLEELILNPKIIRNRLKIFSVRKNAKAFLNIQKEFGSFDAYIWGFVDRTPIKNHWKNLNEVPSSTSLSLHISNCLKKKGMSFVGPTIIYAYMQAIGMVNDHIAGCWKYNPE